MSPGKNFGRVIVRRGPASVGLSVVHEHLADEAALTANEAEALARELNEAAHEIRSRVAPIPPRERVRRPAEPVPIPQPVVQQVARVRVRA